MLKFWVKVIKSNVDCKKEWSELDTEVISTCLHLTLFYSLEVSFLNNLDLDGLPFI